MELLGDVGQVESRFSSFGEKVLVLAQDRCMILPNVQYTRKLFWVHPMELLGDVGQVEAHFCLFADSVNLGAR
jgi:hypothetical protein